MVSTFGTPLLLYVVRRVFLASRRTICLPYVPPSRPPGNAAQLLRLRFALPTPEFRPSCPQSGHHLRCRLFGGFPAENRRCGFSSPPRDPDCRPVEKPKLGRFFLSLLYLSAMLPMLFFFFHVRYVLFPFSPRPPKPPPHEPSGPLNFRSCRSKAYG